MQVWFFEICNKETFKLKLQLYRIENNFRKSVDSDYLFEKLQTCCNKINYKLQYKMILEI